MRHFKAIFVLLLFILLPVFIQAQTEKRGSIVGLNFDSELFKSKNFYLKRIETEKHLRQTSQLFYGNFLKNNFMLGLQLNYTSFFTRETFDDSSSVSKGQSLGIGILARQYLYQKEDFLFFVGIGFRYNFGPLGIRNSSSEYSISSELGINYLISKKIALEAKIGTSALLNDLFISRAALSLGLKYFPENNNYSQLAAPDISHQNWSLGLGYEQDEGDISYRIQTGKFIGSKRKHLIGLALVYSSEESIYLNTANSKWFELTPSYEYFFSKQKFSPFVQISSSFDIIRQNRRNSQSNIDLSLGLAYVLKDHFMIKANFATLTRYFYNSNPDNAFSYKYNTLDLRILNPDSIMILYIW